MSIVLPEVEKSFFELKEVKKQFALYVRDYRMAAIPANSRNGGSWLILGLNRRTKRMTAFGR